MVAISTLTTFMPQNDLVALLISTAKNPGSHLLSNGFHLWEKRCYDFYMWETGLTRLNISPDIRRVLRHAGQDMWQSDCDILIQLTWLVREEFPFSSLHMHPYPSRVPFGQRGQPSHRGGSFFSHRCMNSCSLLLEPSNTLSRGSGQSKNMKNIY